MSSDPTSALELARVMLKEGKRRLLTLTGMFSVTAILALGVGLMLPKKYDAVAMILVESNNVIKPLMEGRTAGAQSVSDQTAIINQIVLGKRVMREVLLFGGWVKAPPARQPDPRQEDELLKKLRAHIKIEVTREEMVHIAFSDSDPAAHLQGREQARRDLRARVGRRQGAREPRGVRVHRQAGQGVRRQAHRRFTRRCSRSIAATRRQGDGAPSADAPTPPTPVARRVAPEDLGRGARRRCAPKRRCCRRSSGASRRRAAPRSTRAPRSRRATRVLQLQGRARPAARHVHRRAPRRQTASARARRRAGRAARAEQGARRSRRPRPQLSAKLDDEVAQAARGAPRGGAPPASPPPTGNAPVRHVATVTPRGTRRRRIDPEMRGVGRDTRAVGAAPSLRGDARRLPGSLQAPRERARDSMELDAAAPRLQHAHPGAGRAAGDGVAACASCT